MIVRPVFDDSEFESLKPHWNKLLAQSAASTIFLTWEWVEAWWRSYGRPGDLRILAAFDDSGELQGIAPMRVRSERRYGQAVKALTFVGDGSNDSEYLDIIAARGQEAAVFEAFRSTWQQDLRNGVVFLLNEVPQTSPHLPLWKEFARGGILTETATPCGTVRLPDTWDAYLALLKPRFRTKVRSTLRNHEATPQIRFQYLDNTAELQRLLPALYDLHTRRWAEEGKPGVFRWEQKKTFYERLSPALLDRGWLRLSWMEWDGQIVACQYGFAHDGIYFHLQEGYEPACDHISVGIGLRAWSLRELIRQGIREYDFLGGVGRHKSDWGAEVKQSVNLQIAQDTLTNRVFCRGPQWEVDLREALGAVVPERLLAARRDYLLGRQARKSGVAASEEETGETGVRRAIAAGYFYSALPSALRKVRDRFVLRTGSGPLRLKLSRRTEPAGRIFYYHRVNNDADPFFPAHSTKAFEEQIRYVAAQYRVVSLRDLIRHLQDGPPEPVVAITFDDGYQDNYRHAWPILQKYGLPATIFLTTGSIDSRQPLWFEQLAEACKRTERQYVDLCIDIPRRFWFRSRDERLRSNGDIFSALRRVKDADRREALTEVVRLLGTPENSDRADQMLTWEQIRTMQAGGSIEFGGHTVSHPFVSKLTPEEARWEVGSCKDRIEQQLQIPVEYFAYPNGREEDMGPDASRIIQTAGYQAALTTIWGMNDRNTNRMELRRGGPWESSLAMFAYKLDWYQMTNE